MLRLIYLYKNITRNKLRTLLTCAAVALPIIVYVMSTAVISGLNEFLDNSVKQLRLVVVHKTSIVNPMPVGHRRKIESLDPTGKRIISVCGMRWLGGTVEGDPTPLSTLAADADSFVSTFPDQQLTQQEIDLWRRDRQAIILGSSTAKAFGWKAGDRITIQPSVPPYTPMEFHVVSTAEQAKDPVTNFCRMDYVEEEMKKLGADEGFVSFFFVKCGSREDLEYFRVAIDVLFSGSLDETKTQDEKSFMSEFINQQFNLPRNLTILAAVTIFVAVMAAANTMSMNIRDRSNEMAVMRSVGFRNSVVFALIQAEGMLLCTLGGVIGAGIPFVLFNFTPLKDLRVPLIQVLNVDAVVCLQALLIAAFIGLIAAIWPAWSASRMTVVQALRNVE